MPEEKVSQQKVQSCSCGDDRCSYDAKYGNLPIHHAFLKPGYISAELPAADAGPRCTCSHNYADHSAVRNHYCMMAGCPCERYELLANPPVPQEAAPRPDCEMWSSPESSLAFDDELNGEADTEHGQSSEELGHSFAVHFKPAPPEAMRQDEPLKALRQWEADTEAPANASEGNAFIDGFNAGREAGSERYQYCDKHKWLNGNDDPVKCPQCLFMKWFDNHENSHGEGCECDQCVNSGFFQDGNV